VYSSVTRAPRRACAPASLSFCERADAVLNPATCFGLFERRGTLGGARAARLTAFDALCDELCRQLARAALIDASTDVLFGSAPSIYHVISGYRLWVHSSAVRLLPRTRRPVVLVQPCRRGVAARPQCATRRYLAAIRAVQRAMTDAENVAHALQTCAKGLLDYNYSSYYTQRPVGHRPQKLTFRRLAVDPP
jgi:hypothetical protein